jgi:serine/threonine-protein kinase
MDAERWERVQRLFHAALARSPDERGAFVREAAADAPDLADEVLALLEEERAADSVLHRGIAAAADAVLGGDGSVPPRIGPYRIERKLGEGGMGVVYLASRADLESAVAIKFLRDARLSPERRRRFLQERRTLARLSHPSICRIHDAGALDDGTPWFAMEYVDGTPLTDYCSRRGSSVDERLRLFREVCDAVQYAHGHALIHRDLKPSNILAVDGSPSIRLLDFGIAREIDEAAVRTTAGVLTPAYASPEQMRGEGYGVSTDVWSLGVLLYELLTGRHPFDLGDKTPVAAIQAVTTADPDPPATGSADLDALCLAALHRDPRRRYGSVEALARDVDHYVAGEPLEARPDSWGYRAGKFVRRHRGAVAASLAIVAALLALVTFYTLRLSAARNDALAQAARTQRIQEFMLDLFEGGDELAGPAKDLRVDTLIERGVRQARALDGEAEIQAELYRTLGGVYRRMKRLDDAEPLLREAWERRRALHGDDHPDAAESRMALALLAADRGDFERAEPLAREALAAVETRLPGDDARLAAMLSGLGEVLVGAGDYPAAIEVLERAVSITDEPRALGRLADAHFYAGDYETSDRLNRVLLARIEQRLGTSHPAYATCLINLGASRAWLGYPDEAESRYRQALAIHEAYYGEDHPTVASTLAMLAAALSDQERYDEARPLLDRAIEIQQRAFGPEHPEVALTLNRLARCELARGDLDGAEAAFARELHIYQATMGEDHPFAATGLSNLSSIEFRRERYDRAEELLRRALAIYLAALKPDHMDVGIARVKLGRLLAHAAGREGEARAELEAGLEILSSQANPSMAWIEYAKKELDALSTGDP